MIDSFNTDSAGWARFSEERDTDPFMRYRLARGLSTRAADYIANQRPSLEWPSESSLKRITFVMLNPSTADAFKLDPTIKTCIRFARMWMSDVDVAEVVNLFAFRTPHPSVLKQASSRGDSEENNREIMSACLSASLVIAAWGNDGALANRDRAVLRRFREFGTPLHVLGRTLSGQPKHPLARGKHRIPVDQKPIPWPNY